MSEKAGVPGCYKGWLWKWTNYVKGYQKRWFVLSNGLLSYYKSQAEVSVACRGTVILAGASIVTEDSCHFTISNGSAHRYHLKASSEVERQRWITALELAKSLSTQMLDSEESSDGESTSPAYRKESVGSSVDVSQSDNKKKEFAFISRQDQLSESEKHEVRATLTPLEVKLADLETCNSLIGKHGTTLLSALADLEVVEKQLTNNPQGQNVGIAKLKVVNERAMLFRITSSAMISACTEFLQVAKVQSKKWQKMLTHEREQRLRLEETVETLAKQHNSLERALNAGTGPPRSSGVKNPQNTTNKINEDETISESSVDKQDQPELRPLNTLDEELSDVDDDEFLDAYEDAYQEDVILEERNAEENHAEDSISSSTSSSHESAQSIGSETQVNDKSPVKTSEKSTTSGVAHRTRIPFKPNYKLNLWSVMKNCIGRDLSKIPMPVNFNEPISLLQRLSEDLEYSEILDRAAKCTDPCEQLAHVAAFSVSSYSTTLFRIGKPFNPLLGETFEFDSLEERGYRLLAEQVSHHPPSAACYAETKKTADHGGWSFWEQITLSSKFRGKYLSVTPIGTCHVKFHKTGHHYTWNKATVTVHNIIVGKLWVDQSGDSNIVNHVTDDKCKITFFPYSYFSRDTPRKVSGIVIDKDGNERFQVFGTWDASMKCKKIDKTTPKSQQHVTILWQKYPLPLLAEKMYYFTRLALILNEWVEGTAPTDSRRRPDQRKMEEGAWDDANKIKLELEEKQRYRRKLREMDEAKKREEGLPVVPYKPKWFKKSQCPLTDENAFVYTHEYWDAKEKQDWSRSTDIFDLSSEKPDAASASTSQPSTVSKDLPKSASEGRLTPSFTKEPVKPPENSVFS